MLFIYWGWDTAVSVNEETENKAVTPGRAAVISTVILLVVYELVVLSAQSYAGLGTKGIGLGNPAHQGDVLSVLGGSIFGSSGFGSFLTHLLLLMVLSSAAASTQTTILPTARTTLSMAVYKVDPVDLRRIHRRFLTPTVSTVVMGVVSIVFYVVMNYVSKGNVIVDSVTALGVMIALYYGLTGLSCFWYYRKTLTKNARDLFMQGILPLLGWAIMWAIGGYSLDQDWGTGSSFTSWTGPRRALGDRRSIPPRRRIDPARRRAHVRLPRRRTAVLPRRGAEPGHDDPRARRRGHAGRAVRHRSG